MSAAEVAQATARLRDDARGGWFPPGTLAAMHTVLARITEAEAALAAAADREARVRALCDEGDRMHGTVRTARLRAALDPQDSA